MEEIVIAINTSDSSDSDDDSSKRFERFERLKRARLARKRRLVQVAEVALATSKLSKSTPTPIIIEEENVSEFLEFITTEEHKLFATKKKTKLDEHLKICINWAKTLNVSVPNPEISSKFMKFTVDLIKKLNIFRLKLLSKNDSDESSDDEHWQEIEAEIWNLQAKLEEFHKSKAPRFTPVEPQVTVISLAENQLSESSRFSSRVTAAASGADRRLLSVQGEPEPTHVDFLKQLDNEEDDLLVCATGDIYDTALKMFICWARNFENALQESDGIFYQMNDLRYEFVTFTMEAIRLLKNVCKATGSDRAELLQCDVLEDLREQFFSFGEILSFEYLGICAELDEDK